MDVDLVTERSPSLLGDAATAIFSPDRRYRYALTRTWDPGRLPTVWVMLNPSTASAFREDNTIRRCIRFARDWRTGGIVVLNCLGLRSTDPSALRTHPDPVGSDNDRVITDLLECGPVGPVGPVVCAWGVLGTLGGRDRQMLDLIRAAGHKPLCLGLSRDGHPRHPLYVPAAAEPVEYAGGDVR